MGELYTAIHNKSFYVALFLIALVPLLAIETPRIIAFIPLIGLLFLGANLNKENMKPTKSDIAMFGFFTVFFVFMAAHSIWLSVSPDAMERIEKSVPLILGGALFLYLIRRTPEFNHEKFYKILMALCGAAAIFVIFETMQGAPVYRMVRGLGADDVVNNAVFNRGSVVIVTVFLTAFFLNTQKKTIYTAACFLPIAAMLFMIESQSAQLGFIFAMAFYFLFPMKWKFLWLALYAAICVYLLSFPFLLPNIYETIPAEFWQNEMLKKSYGAVRIEIWDFVSRKIQENPWTGFGLEFTRGYEDFDARQIYTNRNTILHPHNISLQFWIELGVIGILFLKAAIALSLMYFYHHKDVLVKRAGVTMLLTFLLLNSFSYGFWQSWWIGLMFVISGLILLVSNGRNDIKST